MRKFLLGLSVMLALAVLAGSVNANTFPGFQVYIDIKPGSWPNPLQLRSKGLLPVAILGTEEFDVSNIDPETILLTWPTLGGEGVPPIRWSYEDVAAPRNMIFGNDMLDFGPDGYMDLLLKFKIEDLVASDLGSFEDRDVIMLFVIGHLMEEMPFWGRDPIIILK